MIDFDFGTIDYAKLKPPVLNIGKQSEVVVERGEFAVSRQQDYAAVAFRIVREEIADLPIPFDVPDAPPGDSQAQGENT